MLTGELEYPTNGMAGISKKSSYLQSVLYIKRLSNISLSRSNETQVTYLNILEDCDDEDIEVRVSPPNDDARSISSGYIQWPEYPHQPILLWHDSLPYLKRAASSQLLARRNASVSRPWML